MIHDELSPPDLANLNVIENWRQSSIAQWLGFQAEINQGRLLYTLKFEERHIGNGLIRALHGGVVSSFLQACAQQEVESRLMEGYASRLISIHTNYLRLTHDQDMFARAKIVRSGRRVAFVEVSGWQDNEDLPAARAAVAVRLIPTDTP